MKLFLECKPDEATAKALGIRRKDIIHSNDKGRVCKHLLENPNSMGLIDEDPGSAQPKFLADTILESEKYGVKILKHQRTNSTIVVVCPRLEEWLVNICIKKDYLRKFGFPSKGKELHDVINYRIPKLEELIAHIITDKNPEILYLKQALSR